ncbi:MAG: hypothetical protein ABFD08_09630 [Syntrophomonas sp.]
MLIFSIVFNVLLFFLLINWNYLGEKRRNPDHPDRPLSMLVGLPLALGLVFTLVNRVFRVMFLYQIIVFSVLAALIYWVFYITRKK